MKISILKQIALVQFKLIIRLDKFKTENIKYYNFGEYILLRHKISFLNDLYHIIQNDSEFTPVDLIGKYQIYGDSYYNLNMLMMMIYTSYDNPQANSTGILPKMVIDSKDNIIGLLDYFISEYKSLEWINKKLIEK